jgi:hypothetical protein
MLQLKRYVRLGCAMFLLGLSIYALFTIVNLTTLTLNYNKWASSKINDYSIKIKHGSSQGIYEIGREVVKGGKLLTSPLDSDEPAIDRLFVVARLCALNPFRCSIQYNTQYGYPVRLEEFDFDFGQITELFDLITTNSSTILIE